MFLVVYLSILSTQGLIPSFSLMISLLAFFFIPVFLFLQSFKRNLFFPKKESFFWLAFVLLSVPSLVNSFNLFQALLGLLFYLSLFLLFIYVLNNKELMKKIIGRFIFIVSIFFLGYSLLLNFNPFNFFSQFIPLTGYQFVYARYGLHNHLGDFLVLPIIFSLYKILMERKYFYGYFVMIFLPFVLFSYSRTALVSLIVTSLILVASKHSLGIYKKGLISLFLFLLSLFFLLTVKELNLETAREYIFVKPLIGSRVEYIREGLEAVNEEVLGVGPSNFSYISKKYSIIPNHSTDSSHNIFLDIFVENGILAGSAFVFLVLLFLFNSRKNEFFYLLVATLIIFQFDYIYKSYLFLTLFVIFAGLCYKEGQSIKV